MFSATLRGRSHRKSATVGEGEGKRVGDPVGVAERSCVAASC